MPLEFLLQMVFNVVHIIISTVESKSCRFGTTHCKYIRGVNDYKVFIFRWSVPLISLWKRHLNKQEQAETEALLTLRWSECDSDQRCCRCGWVQISLAPSGNNASLCENEAKVMFHSHVAHAFQTQFQNQMWPWTTKPVIRVTFFLNWAK